MKKVMLYDAPLKGTHLGLVSRAYDHLQIAQLDKNSDFLNALTGSYEFKNIDKQITIKCLICQNDIVVDKDSAKAHFEDVEELDKTHTSIVKPTHNTDISYLALKNFIIDSQEKLFLARVFDAIKSDIVVLLHQRQTHITTMIEKIYHEAKSNYNLYHFVTPPANTKKSDYYMRLGKVFGIEIGNSTDFIDGVKSILKQKKILLYINNFEDNSDERAREFATAIRTIRTAYGNQFNAIIIGQERLASMSYSGDSTLSPLNNTIKDIFPNNANLEYQHIKAFWDSLGDFEKRDLSGSIDSPTVGMYDINDPLAKKVFWQNIGTKRHDDDRLYWKDSRTKNIIRELIQPC